MKSAFFFMLSLLLVVSCGNPHLTQSDDNIVGTDLKTIQVIEKLSVLNLFEVKDSDGNEELNFGQLPGNAKAVKILTITNISEKELSFEMIFDRGLSFNFSGIGFPGENGTCTKILKSKASCTVEIEFQLNVTGIFEDYLIVSHENNKITIPLSGERKVAETKPANPDSFLSDKLAIGTSLDFGSVIAGSTYKKEIEINQFGENDLGIESYQLRDQTHFKISSMGSCGPKLSKSGCKMEISFTPNEEKDFQDTLKIKDKDGNTLELSLKGAGKKAPKCRNYAEESLKGAIGRISNPALTVLPYLTSSKQTSAHLNILYGTDFNIQVKGVSIRTVKDAMVLMDFDLSKLTLKNITDATVDLDVWKIISDSYKDTEMLCLTSKNFKKCSGKIFVLDSWKKLLNPKFWSKEKVLVNGLYQERLAAVETKCGDTSCEVFRGEISLKELFGLSEDDLEKLKSEKIVTLVLADDSRFLSMPKLKFISDIETECPAN